MAGLKVINALFQTMRKTDNTSTEHLEKNRIRSTLESLCDEKLADGTSILQFEALPSALPYVISILEEPMFLEKYDFEQVSETIFQIKPKEMNLL